MKLKNGLLILSIFFILSTLFLANIPKANASGQKDIFISTLSKIPGQRIVKDFGFIYWRGGSILDSYVNPYKAIIYNITKLMPKGANACINLKQSDGIFCEPVLLMPKH